MSRLIELKKARLVELNRADGIVKQTEAATFRSDFTSVSEEMRISGGYHIRLTGTVHSRKLIGRGKQTAYPPNTMICGRNGCGPRLTPRHEGENNLTETLKRK
jgi:hypothetical protein